MASVSIDTPLNGVEAEEKVNQSYGSCGDDAEEDALAEELGIRPYSSIVAFAMCLNCIIGTGCFGLPYAIKEAGLLLTPILLVLGGVLALISMNFTLEALARADAYYQVKNAGRNAGAPQYRIGYRKFDFSRIAELFSGPHGRTFCQVVIVIYGFGTLWGFASMFSSSAASLILSYGFNETCNAYAEDPGVGCNAAYFISLAVFSVVVVAMVLRDVSKQAFVQKILTMYRILAITVMLVTMATKVALNATLVHKRAANIGYARWSMFSKGFGPSILAINCHYNMPDALQPLQASEKPNARVITFAAIIVSISLYLALGVLGAVAFDDVNPLISLNWGAFTGCGASGWDTCSGGDGDGHPSVSLYGMVVQIIIQLFPMLNVISAYPLIGVSMGDNVAMSVPATAVPSWARYLAPEEQGCGGNDTTRNQAADASADVNVTVGARIGARLLCAVPPLLLAACFRQLDLILSIAGIVGFLLSLTVPCFLQIISILQCETEWGTDILTPFSSRCLTSQGVLVTLLVVSIIVTLVAGLMLL